MWHRAASRPEARQAAVIDLGSNSVRLVIYRVEGRAIWTIFNEKALAGLGRDLPVTGKINKALGEFGILGRECTLDLTGGRGRVECGRELAVGKRGRIVLDQEPVHRLDRARQEHHRAGETKGGGQQQKSREGDAGQGDEGEVDAGEVQGEPFEL